ncbi:hypothetical protein [Nonomuraea sp. NPDC049129]|uniref:hypothetical protein n=1 Tax=Nonomuraea sp. NPDC049129 TaxID=3155272 RepID=UPI0033DA9A53
MKLAKIEWIDGDQNPSIAIDELGRSRNGDYTYSLRTYTVEALPLFEIEKAAYYFLRRSHPSGNVCITNSFKSEKLAKAVLEALAAGDIF